MRNVVRKLWGGVFEQVAPRWSSSARGLLNFPRYCLSPENMLIWGYLHSKSRYKIKTSRGKFGYFGKEQVFFARALALAALRLVKYRLTAFFLKDLTYRFMFEFFHLTFFIFVLKVNYLMQLRKNSGFAKFFLILRKSFILSILISMAETAPSCSCIIDLFIRVRG